jgi:hypothetical protein
MPSIFALIKRRPCQLLPPRIRHIYLDFTLTIRVQRPTPKWHYPVRWHLTTSTTHPLYPQTARGSLFPSSKSTVAIYASSWILLNTAIFLAPGLLLALFLSLFAFLGPSSGESMHDYGAFLVYIASGSSILLLSYGMSFHSPPLIFHDTK